MTATPPALVAGTTFLITDGAGDIPGDRVGGLFVDDTRHLSRWGLLVDGQRLSALSAHRDAVSGAAVLVPSTPRGATPPFAVFRTQVLDDGGLVERLRVCNLGATALVLEIRYEVAADFADQLAVRGDREYPRPGASTTAEATAAQLTLRYRREDFARTTTVRPGGSGRCDPDGVRWRLALDPAAEETVTVRVSGTGAPPEPVPGPAVLEPAVLEPAVLEPAVLEPAVLERIVVARRARDDAFRRGFDLPPIAHPVLDRAVRAGLDDLASLLIPAPGQDGARIPGAGAPWFLTLFGRDSIVTALAALPHAPELAVVTLRTLAGHQGRDHRPQRCEEPGKIVHEIRTGELSRFGQVPFARYYGTVDATPLFLVLLGAHFERTGDSAPARELEAAARAAVAWMERDGGLAERGYLVYRTDAPGLVNHCWKDSKDSIAFSDGRPATGPIAVAEAQGYAVDALVRTARLAREVWRDPTYAAGLERQAVELRKRFAEDFWLSGPDFPALAIDGAGQQVDLLASNAGHLLWSGLLDPDRAAAVARRLLSPEFFSGWGLRTIAAGQRPYHPISYHLGGVWPHDTAIAVAGLARYGFTDHARRLGEGLLDAAARSGFRLPEVMAGVGADEVTAPVPYPHSCSPQAWAAAAPLMLLDALGPAVNAAEQP
jgi:glycogen debranching enzyme